MRLTGNSRLCRLLPAGDRERWAPPYGCPTITSLICMTGFRSV